MAVANLPTPHELRQLLRYEPTTGMLFWRVRGPEWFDHEWPESFAEGWNARFAGEEAVACVDSSSGYKTGSILRVRVKAHRVVWAMCRGDWPHGVIDHINGDKTDNRIENLRDTNHIINGRNAKKSKANTSGHTGISWCSQQSKWKVQLRDSGAKVTIGRFQELAEAVAARDEAYRRIGFHENHGKR